MKPMKRSKLAVCSGSWSLNLESGWVLTMARSLMAGVLIVCMLSAACADSEPMIDAVATDTVATANTLEITLDKVAQLQTYTDDPFGGFELRSSNDAIATERTTAVWLINRGSTPLIVTAVGGAEPVIVDTVAAADSAFVRIRTRAASIELSAETSDGQPGGTATLPMDSEPKRAAFPR